MKYWEECIKEAFEESEIDATEKQINDVVEWVEGAHENYSMAHGHDCIPDPKNTEIEELKRKLKREQGKQICRECNGRGSITENFVCGRSSTSRCYKCNGEGFIY